MIGNRDAWRYGLTGLPLAFVALPLYVQLPAHYASEFGVPLATLGALLLLTRLGDALIDPLVGRWTDRLFQASPGTLLGAVAIACVALAGGFTLLFLPPVRGDALLACAAGALVLTYLAYSTISIAHQSWGARLAGDEVQRARIVGWREGFGLAGVLVASVLPAFAGWAWTAVALAAALVIAWFAWQGTPHPLPAAAVAYGSPWLPFRHRAFRALLGVFVANGIASAIPATLLLFFIQDRLQAPASSQALFLGMYFLCAAASMPLWLAAVRRWGLVRSWRAGMLLAIAAFIGAASLGAGDTTGFAFVCMASGLALGSDLALPGALLAGVIRDAGEQGRSEGLFFGWWNFATKLNLALAAGAALPLLALGGYSPGARDPAALAVLTAAYCLLPCALKLGAAVLLQLTFVRTGASS
ncbi:MAG: MFS transporter [Burkholderiales bacterium]|nr:MFS transporter [Burkholderiales bacterium]